MIICSKIGESLLTKEAYGRYLEKIKSEREELTTKLEILENMDNRQIEQSAKTLLELCKRAESAWNKPDSKALIRWVTAV